MGSGITVDDDFPTDAGLRGDGSGGALGSVTSLMHVYIPSSSDGDFTYKYSDSSTSDELLWRFT